MLLAAGAVEGAALGAGQATVLVRLLPDLPVRRWVVATSAAAVLCYALGLLPSTAASVWLTWPAPVVALVGAVVGLVLLGAIGTAQWWVLRHHVFHALRWIPATALAWAGGLAVFLAIAMPWWEPGQATFLVLLGGLVAAVAMAAVVAAVTGCAVVLMLADAATRHPAPP